jgi:hypothetical protein
MTNSTGGDIAAVCFCLRLMTTETRVVRIHSARNRQRDTAPGRSMTTTALGPGIDVQRMIESAAEASQRRKRFHRFCLSICMADRANGTGVVGKQRRMTTDTRRMLIFTRQRRLRGIVFPPVAQQAWESRMTRIVVLKL